VRPGDCRLAAVAGGATFGQAERKDATMSVETYWLTVPLVGLAITLPVTAWLWITRPQRK
jgi:hypothetical protein